MAIQFEQLLSIPEVARRIGRSRWQTSRVLLRMYADDVEQHGKCEWLIHRGPGKKLRVNLSRLRVAHPALFTQSYVDRDEYQELVERVAHVEVNEKMQDKRIMAVSGRVTRLEKSSA